VCSAPFLFPRSIATVSLAGTLPEKLEAAASVGFDGVELFDNDLLTALRPKWGGSAASSVWRSQPFSRSGILRRCRSRNARVISSAPKANSA